MKGVVDVSIDGQGWQRVEAPYWGITEAGTRRILKIVEDTTWITVHPLEFITGEENSLDEEEKEILINELEDILIEKRENKLISHTKTLQT